MLNIKHGILSAVPGGGVGLPDPPPYAGTQGTLSAYSGPTVITTSGATISNKIINGMLMVRASNVTISNCRINAQNQFWGIDADAVPAITGLVVDHCTITGNLVGGNSCVITGDNWRVTNCDLSGLDNGIMCQSGTGLAEGNYIHALGRAGSDAEEAHVDGIQMAVGQNGVVIRGNWIESWDTSCIFMKADYGPINDILIENNTLIIDPAHGGISSPIYAYSVGANLVTNVRVIENRMEAGDTGGYLSTSNSTVEFTGNVDYYTGLPVSP